MSDQNKTTLRGVLWNGPRNPDGTVAPLGSASFPRYQPDPEEEAYYASPKGKRATARALREQAGRLIAQAATLDQEARDAEAADAR